MKPEKFTLRLHALPHVAHFLQNRYGTPVQLDTESLFYMHLREIVSRRPDKDLPQHKPLGLEKYTQELEVVVPQVFYARYGLFMTKTNTIKFNKFCTEYIKDVVRMEMYSSFALTGRKEIGYDVAMQKLDLTPDVFPYETVKKDFQRFRKRKPGLFSKKFLQSLSPILSREIK